MHCLCRHTKGLVRYPFRVAALTTAAFMLAGVWPGQHPLHLLQWFMLVAIAVLQALVMAVWAAIYRWVRVFDMSYG